MPFSRKWNPTENQPLFRPDGPAGHLVVPGRQDAFGLERTVALEQLFPSKRASDTLWVRPGPRTWSLLAVVPSARVLIVGGQGRWYSQCRSCVLMVYTTLWSGVQDCLLANDPREQGTGLVGWASFGSCYALLPTPPGPVKPLCPFLTITQKRRRTGGERPWTFVG
jgi:hypothetical protein